MSPKNKNRLRNKTISFRVSPEEAMEINARILVCGMPKAEFFIKSLINDNIFISVGKYESDILGIELLRFRRDIEQLKHLETQDELKKVIERANVLLTELCTIIKTIESDTME